MEEYIVKHFEEVFTECLFLNSLVIKTMFALKCRPGPTTETSSYLSTLKHSQEFSPLIV